MRKANRILLVDDDHDILDLLQYNFEREGFSVKAVDDSTKAIETCVKFSPNLIILDIMMPDISGIELCKRLRDLPDFHDTYIFFLTAKSENYYQQAALDIGGDDFIEKIMGLRALTNKVVTVLKNNFIIRKRIAKLSIGNLTIHRHSSTASVKGHEVSLSKPELELLYFFAQNPRKIITDENLQSNIWGSNIYSISLTLELYIENLSAKLGGKWITCMGDGRYRFNVH